jgi:hypothetical protein
MKPLDSLRARFARFVVKHDFTAPIQFDRSRPNIEPKIRFFVTLKRIVRESLVVTPAPGAHTTR